MSKPSDAQVWIDDRAVEVALSGDLAGATAMVLEQRPAMDAEVLVVDLTAVTRVDGEGLEQLIELVDRATAAGVEVRYCQTLRGAPPR
jgi:anti-anti-sigma regulatory factor